MKEYTVREYEMEDYEAVRDFMTDEEVLQTLQYIDRGYIPDYNFTGKEDDFEHYKLHMAMFKAMDLVKERMKANEGIDYN